MTVSSFRMLSHNLSAETFTTLERRLILRSDSSEVLDYVRRVYRRVRVEPSHSEEPACDTGYILTNTDVNEPWLFFNGDPIELQDGKPSTQFGMASYGSNKLFRLSFRRNINWYSLYAAALRLGDRAVIISARSGIGKTTLSLELLSRGARFYGDEFVFIRKNDKFVSGLARCLLIREHTLAMISDPRLRAVCEVSTPRTRNGDRVWDNIDAGDVFGEDVFAQPAPLSVAIMLERGCGETTTVKQIPAALAAVEFIKRVNADMVGFERLADSAQMLAGIPCYRVVGGSPQRAADAVEALLR